ncbi:MULTISPECIES: hypothetical protein [Thioclava]|uniref:Uncharacterized protein n=1 Tax=Thioclava litoralis TaxID=3076557 RepID=A0ABZ1E1Q9_9RHOB|nr:hypothetical protein RPE78_05150 [Thioclava sp. FTW29]
MFGLLIAPLTALTSRLIGVALVVALWLISRPGGWAVLVVLILVGVKLLPEPASHPDVTSPAPVTPSAQP